MSLSSEGRFKNLPEEDRKILEAAVEAGEEVVNLLEGCDDSMESPTTPTVPKRKRKSPATVPTGISKLVRKLVAKEMKGRREGQQDVVIKPPQVRAAPPALFSGKRGSFMFFARKLVSYAKLTSVPENKLVALGVQHLEERPLKVWDAYVRKLEREGLEEEALTWEDFTNFMSKRYDSTDTVAVARQKLDKVYQGNESVEKYIERFIALTSDVETEYQMMEQDKIHLFLKGLSTPLRVACTINPGTGKPFTDLDDLCSFVVKYEGGLKSFHGDGQGGPTKKRVVSTYYPQLGAVHPEEVPFNTPVASWAAVGVPPTGIGKVDSRKFIPPDRQCYFCKALGHEAWQCNLKREYLANKAKAGGYQPPVFKPAHYPTGPKALPVAAPVQGGAPLSPSFTGIGTGIGKGKGKGKGKFGGKRGKGKFKP